MADAHQTFFSFELFVEYVRLDSTQDIKPAVAVRLLDFPTFLIYRTENENSSDSSSKPGPLLPSESNSCVYCFNKGKSCLFKSNLDSLYNHLSNTPLYAMVLNIKNDVPDVIGSSIISLAELACCIKLSVEKDGNLTPAAYGEKMISSVLNILGDSIGTIFLVYKIVSLGSSLTPHIFDSKFCEKYPYPISKVATPGMAAKTPLDTDDFKPPCPENHTNNFYPAVMPSKISDTKKPHVATVSTQTEHIKKKYIRYLDAEIKSDDGQHCSTFCPPPMYYSSCEKNLSQQQLGAESSRMLNNAMKNLRMVDLNTENEKALEVDCADQKNGLKWTGEEMFISNLEKQQGQNMPAVLTDVVRQLPMFSALLIELSHLSEQMQHEQHPLSIQRNLINLDMSAQKCSPALASGKLQNTENLHAAASPVQTPIQPFRTEQRHGNPQVPHKSYISPLNSLQKEPVVKSHYQRHKLRYGLTHSFHLRLKQIQPAMTRHHECMEELKNKQVEPQRKRSSNYTQDYKTSPQNRDFLESCATLLNSLETDGVLHDIRSHSPKSPCFSKNLKKQSKFFSRIPNSKDFHVKADKEVQVCFPSVLGQYIDQNDHDSVGNNHLNVPCLIQTGPDISHSIESGWGDGRPCRPSNRSDFTHSPEADEYQDDFTSLDHTDGLPDPCSSPDQHRLPRTQAFSGNSSVSYCQRGKLHHVPAKATISPKSPPKGTHMIKPHIESYAWSTSSDNSKSGFPKGFVHRQRISVSSSCSTKNKTVPRFFETLQNYHAKGNAPVREQSVDMLQPSDDSMLESVSSTESVEKRDELGSLGIWNKYQPISELMVNKLPGYTL